MSRECGGCTACCSVFYVGALDKPAYERCSSQTDKGCAIYNLRYLPALDVKKASAFPTACGEFFCSWVEGDACFDEEDRPDKSGVIPCRLVADAGQVYQLVPTSKGQEGTEALARAAKKLADQNIASFIMPGEWWQRQTLSVAQAAVAATLQDTNGRSTPAETGSLPTATGSDGDSSRRCGGATAGCGAAGSSTATACHCTPAGT